MSWRTFWLREEREEATAGREEGEGGEGEGEVAVVILVGMH
jgi:hypothetical protein